MAGQTNDKPKSAKRRGRDAAFFFAGMGTGSLLTIGAGVLADKVKDIPGLPSTQTTPAAAAVKK